MSSLLEEFLRGFGNAVADIREKVIEEPWFGRPVTPAARHGDGTRDLMKAFFEGHAHARDNPNGKAPSPSGPAPAVPGAEQDRCMDPSPSPYIEPKDDPCHDLGIGR